MTMESRRAAAFSSTSFYGLVLGLVGPSVPALRASFSLDYATASLHLTGFSAGALLGSILADRAERRLGRRRVVVVAMITSGLGALTVALAPLPTVSLVGCLVAGLAGVAVTNVGQAVLGEQAQRKAEPDLARSQAFAAAGLAGAALLVAIAGVAPPAWSWRLAWTAPALLAAVLIVNRLPARLASEADGEPSSHGCADRDLGPSGPSHATVRRLAATVTGLGVALEWGVTFWAAAYLTDQLDLPEVAATGATAIALGGLVIGRALLPRLAGRWSAARLLGWTLVLALVGSAPYLVAPALSERAGQIVALIALAVLCLAVAGAFPLGLSLTMSLAPHHAQSKASAEAMGAGAVTGIAAPFLLGGLADATSLSTALLALPLLALTALGLLGLLLRMGPPS